MRSARFTSPDTTAPLLAADPDCNHSRCPQTRDAEHPLRLSADSLPEGITRLRTVRVDDPADRTSPEQTLPDPSTVRVDREGPQITTSGRLSDLANKVLYADTYGLSITGKDAQSGVRRIEVTVDGVGKVDQSADCSAGGCALSASLSFAGVEYAAGPHTVAIKATDQVGNTSTKQLSVTRSTQVPQDATEADLLEAAQKFRADFGLTTDPAIVKPGLNEPDQVQRGADWTYPLTAADLSSLDTDPYMGGATTRAVGATASVSFDRQGAVTYADRWVHDTPAFPFGRFGDTDCANFVSQAWHFGAGLRMTNKWFLRKSGQCVGKGGCFPTRRFSAAWVNAQGFAYYFGSTKIAALEHADEHLDYHPGKAGDAILYDHGKGEGFSHLAIAVGTANGIDRIDQHTTDRRHTVWNRDYVAEPNARYRHDKRAIVVHLLG